MDLDDETVEALGYGRALDRRPADWLHIGDADGARPVVLVKHMTPEQRRAHWRKQKAAWRAAKPELARDACRRQSRYRGCVPRERYLREIKANARTEAERIERSRSSRRRYMRLLAESWRGEAERVVTGMDVARVAW